MGTKTRPTESRQVYTFSCADCGKSYQVNIKTGRYEGYSSRCPECAVKRSINGVPRCARCCGPMMDGECLHCGGNKVLGAKD